jgi:hypothetical protein
MIALPRAANPVASLAEREKLAGAVLVDGCDARIVTD